MYTAKNWITGETITSTDLNHIENGISSHAANITTVHNPEAAIAPTLINSWVNLGGGYPTAGYWKDTMEIVHLKGMIGGGIVGTVAFILSSEYRPLNQIYIATNSNHMFGEIHITTDGSVTLAIGSSGWFELDSVNFRVI